MRRPFRTALVIALCAHASVAIAFVRARPGNAAPRPPSSLASQEREVSLVDSPAEEEPEPIVAARAFESRKHVVSARAAVGPAKASASASANANADANADPDANVALVREALHAALGSRVPVKSSAVVWTTAGADGSLVDAEATNASSDIEAWNEVAAEVVRAMKGQRVRAVLGARGARLSFRVESLVRQGAGNAVAPSVRVGTPLYRCMEACTASGNIDPSDALLNAASRPERFVDVRALSSTRID